MLSLIGLDNLSSEALMALLALGLLVTAFSGWISDAIMKDAAFGVIGNSLLSLMAILIGLAVWSKWVGPLAFQDIVSIIAFTTSFVVASLLGLALLRRFL